MKVLGLKPGFSADDLANAHKTAVRQFHPDRPGGNAEKMVQANNARDALKGQQGRGGWSAQDDEDYYGTGAQQRHRDMEEKRKAYAQVAKEAAEAHLKLDAFVSHFTNIFEEPFSITKAGWWTNDPTQASYAAEFTNAVRSIVTNFTFYIDYSDLFGSKTLSNPEVGLNMTISSTILYNRKKVKLSQSNYRLDRAYKVLSDPDVLFPSAKLKTQAAKSTTRKLSKRDVLLTFEKELNADVQYSGPQIWVYVPVGRYRIAFYRISDARFGASWAFNGIYEKHRRVVQTNGFVSIAEDDKSMTFIMNALRDLQRNPSAVAETLATEIDGMLHDYKSVRGY